MMRRRFNSNKHEVFDYANYMTVEAIDDTVTVSLPRTSMYGIDGIGWRQYSSTIKLKKGQMLSVKDNVDSVYGNIIIKGKCNLRGNCMSLVYGDNANEATILKERAFQNLFTNNTGIQSVDKAFLPATTLVDRCYEYMFRYCSGLTQAPELPSTKLAQCCYQYMFSDCKSLITAPELPATTLASGCYRDMFSGCISLITAPELPATTSTNSCYYSMFRGCTSLTTAPELPATTLYPDCYTHMFENCKSLITAPELPATTLSNNCYWSMFSDCTSLTTAPELPATTLAAGCYRDMFNNCEKLNYIKMLATDISAYDCLNGWVHNVSSTGIFVKSKDATWDVRGMDGIPKGWAVITEEEEESNPLNVILNINANNGEEGVRVYNYISEKAPWISSAFDNLFIEGLYEGSMLSAKVISAVFIQGTLVLSYEGQGAYDMCSLSPDGYLELVFND